MKSPPILENNDCTDLFKQAYENRYTWNSEFCGYEGACSRNDGQRIIKGIFSYLQLR